ncbi:MAG: hypothetical protein IJU44_06005 [Kiritimatiellae bacterium]|nr:hypothetical protein [Kiritimatiellia bacterium]
MKLFSPIAFDMGAVNTGIVMTQFCEGEETHYHPVTGATLSITHNDLTLGYKSRTQKRHQIRGYKRRKMAKRLLWTILKNRFGLDAWLAEAAPEKKAFVAVVNGILNRRGFTFYTENTSELPEVTDLIAMGFDFLNPDQNLAEQLPELVRQGDAITKHPIFGKQNNKDLKRRLEQIDCTLDKFKATKKSFLSVMETATADLGGHKHRPEYFENIRSDIATIWETALTPLGKAGFTPDTFASLVGHISNLQLRCLRKYFNVETWKTGDRWDEPRMAEKFRRYVRGWHAEKQDDVQNKKTLLKWLADNPGKVIDLWLSYPPKISIPPYEDQNNRHPPKCATLLLDPEVLDQDYPEWRSWIPLMDIDGFLAGFPESGYEGERETAVRKLQVIFDRSKRSDVVRLRRIITADKSDETTDDRGILSQRLGSHLGPFLDCAKRYYEESNVAAHGGWYPTLPDRLLKVCGKNPPHKDKVAHLIVGHLLGVDLNADDIQDIHTDFLSKTKVERQFLINLAEASAKLIKKMGAAFHDQALREEDSEWKRLEPRFAPAGKCLKAYLVEHFGLDPYAEDARFADPYVWSQLYNVLKGDVHGFSKTCRCCSEDNRFRSSTFCKDHGEPVAHAKRLPSNTDEPFDGVVARLSKRVGYEAAQMKADQIAAWIETQGDDTCSEIVVPIIIEENRFEFTLNVMDIKGTAYPVTEQNKKRLKDIRSRQEELWETSWREKNTRIRDDGKGICPYCGKPVSVGQIDHILARAYSIQRYGTVFNSEPNLILSHYKCNVEKSNSAYTLHDLAPVYLEKQFGTTDIHDIQAHLIENYMALRKGNLRLASGFAMLPEDARQTVRHLLFADDCACKKELIRELRQICKSHVNGTQRWLAKQFGASLRAALADRGINLPVSIEAIKIDAEEASYLRSVLSEHYSEYAKQEEQPLYSHILDAAMGLTIWAEQRDQLGAGAKASEEAWVDWVKRMLPKTYQAVSVTRKKSYQKDRPESQRIFKDTLYGDKFLPFVVTKSRQVGFGFSPGNAVFLAKSGEGPSLYLRIKPFLRADKTPPPDSLDGVFRKIETGGRPFICPFDADKVRTFLHTIAHEPSAPDSLKTADLLDALHYSTHKQPVQSVMCEYKNNKPVKILSRDAVIQKIKDGCTLKINVRGFKKEPIQYPSFQRWMRIINLECFNEKWATATSANDPLWEHKELSKFFSSTPPGLAHDRTRKVFSLPLLESPSGGFRIGRRNPFGTRTWQTISAPAVYSGFAVTSDGVNFSTPVVQTNLTSRNIHGFGGRFAETGNYVRMDAWRQITLTDEEKTLLKRVFLAPGTNERMYAKVELYLHAAEQLLSDDAISGNLNSQLKAKMKIPPSRWASLPILLPFKCRDNKPISILARSDDCVVAKYSLNGFPASLKKRYNEAFRS